MRSIERAEAQPIRLDRAAFGGTLGERIVAKARVAAAVHMAQPTMHIAKSARLVRDRACGPRMSRCASAKEIRT